MLYDINKLDKAEIYKIVSSVVIPRPIAWISTYDSVLNIAPFSYFTPLSSEPACVIVSIGHKQDGTYKDTLANILKTKKATISFVIKESLDDLKNSAISLPKDVSEAEEFDIKTKQILDNFPPIIENTPVALFCSFNQIVDIGGLTIPVILNIESIYIDDSKNIDDIIGRFGKDFVSLKKI